MKPNAVIVNTSRGEVIDENALTRMLRAGELGGAGLDVYENGTDVNPRLRELPNVVLLPHMGSATVESRLEMGEKVIINIKTFDDGHRPPDQVFPLCYNFPLCFRNDVAKVHPTSFQTLWRILCGRQQLLWRWS